MAQPNHANALVTDGRPGAPNRPPAPGETAFAPDPIAFVEEDTPLDDEALEAVVGGLHLYGGPL